VTGSPRCGNDADLLYHVKSLATREASIPDEIATMQDLIRNTADVDCAAKLYKEIYHMQATKVKAAIMDTILCFVVELVGVSDYGTFSLCIAELFADMPTYIPSKAHLSSDPSVRQHTPTAFLSKAGRRNRNKYRSR